MPNSMTGYGRHATDTEIGEITWELRSVNHRYLELAIRMPEELRALEPRVRECIGKRVNRGKLDVALKLRAGLGSEAVMRVDSAVLDSLNQAIQQVRQHVDDVAAVDPVRLLQWPGVVATGGDDKEALAERVIAALEAAIDDFLASRMREGEKTAKLLRDRAGQIAEHVATVRRARSEVVQRQKDRLLAKLAELDIEHEPARLEQELVYAAQRLDIDEELDRLETHIVELDKALARQGPIGRRLDFLMQEFNREANTVGSKSNDTDTTGATVDIKVLIEQMREQVQNIE